MRRVKKLLINVSRSKNIVFFHLISILLFLVLLVSDTNFIQLIVCWSVVLFFDALIQAFKNIDEQTAYKNSFIKILLSRYEFALYVHELILVVIFYISLKDISISFFGYFIVATMMIFCYLILKLISFRISEFFKAKLKTWYIKSCLLATF